MSKMNPDSRYEGTPIPPTNPGTPEHYDWEEEENPAHIYVGGRKSKLAVVQSRYVAERLRGVHPGLSFPVVALSTLGDNVQTKPLYAFGGKALWTKELEVLLLNKVEGYDQLDMVVHSLKDMPTTLPDGCILGAITEREDARDAVCMRKDSPYKNLRELPKGSVVGTSSLRRTAQLRRSYPNLKFESVRGTLQTRLDKCDSDDHAYEAIILAAAGLNRLGLSHRITSHLDTPDMYYAVGQGALGVEIRSNDPRILKLVARVNHHPTFMRCTAERALMKTLEGGCSVPIGVESSFASDTNILTLTGIVVSVDGTEAVEGCVSAEAYSAEDAESVGQDLAADLIAKGAKKILDEIHLDHIN